MLETFAKAFVYTLAVYAGLGLVFAVPFVWPGVARLIPKLRDQALAFDY